MDIKVIVFDFDGTLIDSQPMKLEAFYKLFPKDDIHDKMVTAVLQEIPEESRYIILEKILERIEGFDLKVKNKVNQLADAYNDIVVQGAKKCKEMSGATDLLKKASNNYRLFISSNTPRDSLQEIISYRGWLDFFINIYGYPCDKLTALQKIIASEKVNPEEVLVVGDGKTDQLAAKDAGCFFYEIRKKHDLDRLKRKLGYFSG